MMNLVSVREEKRHFYKLVFSLVLPMALQNLINVSLTTADVVMLGKVSETSLSASSLAGQVQFIMMLILFGLTSGAGVLASQYWGKKDIKTIEKILGITMRIALMVSVGFTAIVLLFPYQTMSIFSNEKDVIKQGVSFLQIIAVSYIFNSITMVYFNILRSIERVILATIVYSVSLTVNIILNAIFIFGMFGLEPMGIRGSALATLIARSLELVIVLIYALFINKDVRLHLKNLFPHDKPLMQDFMQYSMPVLFNEFVWGAGTAMNAAIIGHLGQDAVAASSVTQVTRQLAMIIAFGVANATAILVGKAIGENELEKAKLYAKRFLRLSFMMGIIGACVILGISVFAKDMFEISEQAKTYLSFMMIVMSYFAICQSINAVVIVGICRAGGDTKFGVFLDGISLWFISIPLSAIAAFILRLPVQLVYIILLCDEVLKAPVSYWRYKTMKWLKNVTR